MLKRILISVVLICVCMFSVNVYADDKPNADFMVENNYVSCGSPELVKNIPAIIPRISSSLYNTVMVVVPVILILLGMVDLVKGIMSQKEDEIKKGREVLVKRLITGLIIFLIVLLVKLFTGILSGSSNSARIVSCIDCFISNQCSK